MILVGIIKLLMFVFLFIMCTVTTEAIRWVKDIHFPHNKSSLARIRHVLHVASRFGLGTALNLENQEIGLREDVRLYQNHGCFRIGVKCCNASFV